MTVKWRQRDSLLAGDARYSWFIERNTLLGVSATPYRCGNSAVLWVSSLTLDVNRQGCGAGERR
ncbi:hypothetical protein [Paenibacillus antarcticus]|uniref:hypothetical protein n=1 Tax=Paenibacillus antarcticus TaxID=253703 RepID=UPI0011F19ED6|nr:hypothetical protein [Paenibacillus antarcticus]